MPHSMQATKILVVDDEPKLREILYRWLTHFGYEAHVAADGLSALALVKQHAFDVVVTDLKMPGFNGLQMLSILKELDPTIEVIFLTGQGTIEDAIEALRGGRAFDFIQKPLKDFGQINLVIQKALIKRQEQSLAASAPTAKKRPEHPERFSEREREILALLAQGLDNRAIADQLCLSEKTIKNNLTRVYEKLRVSTRAQAILACQQYGFGEA